MGYFGKVVGCYFMDLTKNHAGSCGFRVHLWGSIKCVFIIKRFEDRKNEY